MGMIVSGILVTAAIAFGSSLYLSTIQPEPSSWKVFTTQGARVDDPGYNLVGQNWSGDPGNVRPDDKSKTPG